MLKIYDNLHKSAFRWLGMILLGLSLSNTVFAARIKDVVSVQGVRQNQLVGYGLVVGLDGTGDQTTQTPFTTQSLQNMLTQLGISLPPGANLQLKNVAAAMITASLPAFSQPGQALDVTVSSLGNAKSLRGGTLLLTPLKGADGLIYAMAQGNLVIGGAGASSGGSQTQINHLSAGRIPSGATVERTVANNFESGTALRLELNTADFGTAQGVVAAVNRSEGDGVARALDARVIELQTPATTDQRVAFLARIEALEVNPTALSARVIVNARTGSVVMNQSVRLAPVAVSHGNLSVTISQVAEVSQPAPLSEGKTVITKVAEIQVNQAGSNLMYLKGGAQLSEVVKALNFLGANPQDLISILQAMRAAGALTAELEII